MADLRIVLIWLALVTYTSAATYFVYPGKYPTTYFNDFMYVPTDQGYMLWFTTIDGVVHREMGAVADARSHDIDDSNPDTLGSSNKGRAKSKLPLKNRKVSPKLLASLSG